MIRVQWHEPTARTWVRWKAKCERKTVELIQVVAGGQAPVIGNLYAKQKSVLVELFNHKCAYCEQRVTTSQHGDIDHFRPKAAVSNEDWSIVDFQRDGRTGPHKGYYWLAYSASNLLLTCILCNQVSVGKRGKGTRFPVEAFRAEVPGEEQEESPLLVNPCFDDPEEYLSVDAIGTLWPKGGNERGRATIEILGLNDRGLPKERADKFRSTIDTFNAILAQREAIGMEEAKRRLLALKAADQPFALAARNAVAHAAKQAEDLASAAHAS